MNLHMNRVAANAEASGEIPLETMKRYIAYCKSYVLSCLLSPHLGANYKRMRKQQLINFFNQIKN
jgi:DNA replicative helicase MCM subunit Mcm2 (Cdc46/Mcm family)